jgi:hypothetical protein
MHRLFTTLRVGPPGAGLLVWRCAVAGAVLVISVESFLDELFAGGRALVAGTLIPIGGASMLLVFLTPFGLVADLISIRFALATAHGIPVVARRSSPRCWWSDELVEAQLNFNHTQQCSFVTHPEVPKRSR